MLQLAPWFLLAPAVVVVGGLVDDPARAWIWLGAIAIDVVGALSVGRRRLPRVARPFRGAVRAVRDHRARRVDRRDRCGRGSSSSGTLRSRSPSRSRFAGVGALWWAYFDFAGARHGPRAAPDAARAARAGGSRRLQLLPLPDRPGDHLLRRRREEDARAPRRPALGRRPCRPRSRRRGVPARLRARPLPGPPPRRLGAAARRRGRARRGARARRCRRARGPRRGRRDPRGHDRGGGAAPRARCVPCWGRLRKVPACSGCGSRSGRRRSSSCCSSLGFNRLVRLRTRRTPAGRTSTSSSSGAPT